MKDYFFILDVTTQTYQAGIQKLDRQLADIQVEVDKSGQRIKANLQAIKQEEQGTNNKHVSVTFGPPKGRVNGIVIALFVQANNSEN